MHFAQKIVLLALAGAFGTLARYGIGALIDRHVESSFPWPVFAVNMCGCLMFGAFYAMSESRLGWSGDARVVVLAGFMGAFTTYSTFAFQSAELLRDANWMGAAANILGQNVLGIVFVFVGLALGKTL